MIDKETFASSLEGWLVTQCGLIRYTFISLEEYWHKGNSENYCHLIYCPMWGIFLNPQVTVIILGHLYDKRRPAPTLNFGTASVSPCQKGQKALSKKPAFPWLQNWPPSLPTYQSKSIFFWQCIFLFRENSTFFIMTGHVSLTHQSMQHCCIAIDG